MLYNVNIGIPLHGIGIAFGFAERNFCETLNYFAARRYGDLRGRGMGDNIKMAIYIFGGLSLIWTLASAYLVFFRYSKKEHISGRIPVVTLYTVCLFISMWVMLIPAYFLNYKPEDGVVGTLFLSLLNTMQTFILEGSGDTYDFLTSAAGDEFPAVLRVLYSGYAALLLFAAPLMTFSNVLLLFGDWWGNVRFWFRRHGSVYIISELNSRSVILAKSIKREKREEKPVIVFAGMARIDEDESYDQILEAKNMKAILLKKDITRIGLKALKKAELFFISDNEAENIDNAVLITKELKESKAARDIKLFPFAHVRVGGYTLDSLEYDSLLQNAKDQNSPEQSGITFKLRRIDDIMLTVQSAVAGSETPEDIGIGRELIKHATAIEGSGDKLISVLIVGMGDFGTEFFKMLSWYCQIDGYRLEMNLADRSDDLESQLRRDLPELMEYGDDKNTDKHSEENYSVRCLPGVDIIKTNTLAKILQAPENDTEKEISDRLKRTTAVIVALGADTDNIESAIYLRTLFDKVCPPADKKHFSYETERVRIYSVVYDEKSGQRETEQNVTELINYKKMPYDIKFIGGMKARYSHKNIYDPTAEAEAFGRHVAWAKTSKAIVKKRNTYGECEETIIKEGYFYKCDENEELKNYDRFEYFRRSSMASILYRRMLENEFPKRQECKPTLARKRIKLARKARKKIKLNPKTINLTLEKTTKPTPKKIKLARKKIKLTLKPIRLAPKTIMLAKHRVDCECSNCTFLKKSEHMRWYAYMCTEGFIYGKERADRAKMHHDMKPWSELNYWEKHKDWWGAPENGDKGGR